MSWLERSKKDALKNLKITNRDALRRVRDSAPTAILLRHFNQHTFVNWMENNNRNFYNKKGFFEWKDHFLYLDSEHRLHGDHNEVLRTLKKDLTSFLGIQPAIVEVIIARYLVYLKQELICALQRNPDGLYDGYVMESEKQERGFLAPKNKK